MKGFHIPKRFWVVIGTLLVVAIGFVYYFLVFVENKEEDFYAKRFRSLKRMSANIVERKKDARKVGENNFNFSKKKQVNDAITEFFNNRKGDLFASLKADPPSDTLRKRNILELADCDFKDLTTAYIRLIDISSKKTFFQKKNVAEIVLESNLQKNYFSNFFLIRKTSADTAETKDNPSAVNPKVVVNCGDCKKEKSGNGVTVVAFQTFENKIQIESLDTLLDTSAGLQTSPIVHTTINGINSVVFIHRMEYEPGEDWILCGSVTQEEFDNQNTSIELFWTVILIIVSVFVLLSMPIVKLAVMSPVERLQIRNVWFTGFALIVGTSVLTLLILFFNDYQSQSDADDKNLELLSAKVQQQLGKELESIKLELDSLAQFPNQEPDSGEWKLVRYKKGKFLWRDLKYPKPVLFSQVIWMNQTGDQNYVLESDLTNKNPKPVSLRNRKYFSHIIHDSLWYSPGSKRGFSFQPIRSWRSGNHEVGLGMKLGEDTAKNAPVAVAMVRRLYSVTQPLLPPGFGFAIVNKTGDVLFHSDMTRNLQENFFEESSFDNQVTAATRGRLLLHHTVNYHEKDHRVFVAPISGLPLTLIAFCDREYSKSPYTLTLGLVSYLIVAIFFIQGIQVLLLFSSTYQSTKLRIKRFFLNWLKPRMDEHTFKIYNVEAWKASTKYKCSILFQLAILIGMSLLTYHFPERWLVLCFLTLPICLSAFHFLLFRREHIIYHYRKTKKVFWFLPLPLNAKVFFNSFLWFSVGGGLLINWWATPYIEDTSKHIVVQLSIAGIGILLLGLGNRIDAVEQVYNDLEKLLPWRKKGKNRGPVAPATNARLYLSSTFLWLLLAAVLPVVCFYNAAHHLEFRAWTRYMQLEASQNKFARDRSFQALGVRDNKGQGYSAPFADPRVAKYIDTTGNYLRVTNVFTTDTSTKGSHPLTPTPFFNLLLRNGPTSRSLVEESRQAVFDMAYDSLWQWSESGSGDTLVFTRKEGKGSNLVLSSVIPDYKLFNNRLSYIFIIVFALLLWLLYKLIRFCAKYIYGLGLLQLDSRCLSQPLNLLFKPSRKRLFIVGLPFSDLDLLRRVLKQRTIEMLGSAERTQEVNRKLEEKAKRTDVADKDEAAAPSQPKESSVERARRILRAETELRMDEEEAKAKIIADKQKQKNDRQKARREEGRPEIIQDEEDLEWLEDEEHSQFTVIDYVDFRSEGLSGLEHLDSLSTEDLKPPSNARGGRIFNVVVLDHFEHGMNDHAANAKKLKVLHELNQRDDIRIIILSHVQPSVVLDYYDTRILEMMPKVNDEKIQSQFTKFKHAARHWKNALSGYTISIASLTKHIQSTVSPQISTRWLISEEIAYGEYLPTLRSQLRPFKKEGSEDELGYQQWDEIALCVEGMAETYYQSLWNNFSNNEKFLLYDLAKDRFVNLRNRSVIDDLLKKGVLEIKDSLQLMNRSFNNFILLAVKEDEELKMEAYQREKGTWHSLQLVIVILILAAATFIAFSQKSLLNNVNAWIGALTGITTLIVRFGGLFSTGKVKD